MCRLAAALATTSAPPGADSHPAARHGVRDGDGAHAANVAAEASEDGGHTGALVRAVETVMAGATQDGVTAKRFNILELVRHRVDPGVTVP